MLPILRARSDQGHRTLPFPPAEPALPARFRGLPVINKGAGPAACAAAAKACPTGALDEGGGHLTVDLGKCVFCGECAAGGKGAAVAMSRTYRAAASTRAGLVTAGDGPPPVAALEERTRRM